MRRISPKKLHNSKWTALRPEGKSRHFMVVELEHDEAGDVVRCMLEAVVTKRTVWLPWRELNDEDTWQQGWT